MNLRKLCHDHVLFVVIVTLRRASRLRYPDLIERLKMARTLGCVASFIWMLYGSSLFLTHSIHMVNILPILKMCPLLSLSSDHRNAANICKMAVDASISVQNSISKDVCKVGFVHLGESGAVMH